MNLHHGVGRGDSMEANIFYGIIFGAVLRTKHNDVELLMSLKKIVRSGFLAATLLLCAGIEHAFGGVTVSVQPGNQTVLVGGNVVFTANVTTTAGEVITGYTWQMSTNGLNPFVAVATGVTCTLTNLQTTNAGYYFVQVSYQSGANSFTQPSAAATLTVNDQARLTSQPQNLNQLAGSNAVFSVTALGMPPLIFQWRFNGTNLANDTRTTGVYANTLTISNLIFSDSGNYDVVVTNLYAAVTSQVATLNVLVPPQITAQPTNLTVITGSNATFQVAAIGTAPVSFRWMKGGTNLSNGGRISGATTNILVITGALTNDNGNYSVTVSNAVGVAVSSNALLAVLVPPVITSSTNAAGQQGHAFSYTVKATGTIPITFGADGLPDGLAINPTNGVISGIPTVSGNISVTLYATNAALTATGNLTLALANDIPGIKSSLVANGMQGQPFNYTIAASNDPVTFSTSPLPPGFVFNPVTGVISGTALTTGTAAITIGAANIYGADSKTLTINLGSGAPVITSPLTVTGTENQTNFTYTITASNSPAVFGATGLPLGLTVNTNTGLISGTPLYGGPFSVVISAANIWGTTTNTLQMNLTYAALSGLSIDGVTATYSAPYLLDYSFSLRDDSNPNASVPVVRPTSQIQVTCLEDGQPVGSETAVIFEPGDKKQLKTFLVLDYTYSMLISPGAIGAMQTSAETLINEEPATAQFGIYEFNADYEVPQLVTGFMTDKTFLNQTIEGIQTNFVQNNYAGTRVFDAMYSALSQFGTNNSDEQRYLVVMTDGNDDSSLLDTNASPVNLLVALAQTNNVSIYCVGYGTNINVAVLQQLTSQTKGQYYAAATTTDLPAQFLKIVKDIDGQYLLRWATLKRAAQPFKPTFQVTVGGFTANFAPTITYTTNITIITNTPPAQNMTNIVITSTSSPPNYNPPDWAGNVQIGSLRLVADADVGPQTIRLRATYVPHFVTELRVDYQANYPCTVSLDSTGPGEILSGWTLTQTNDGAGGQWLTLTSPNTTNLLTSIPYGAFGDLLTFSFQYPDQLTSQTAFSTFSVDNTIYTNPPSTGQSFVLANTNLFITYYGPPPPHGTPIPWLLAYGFTSDFTNAELSDVNGNGLAVWQDYVAGLNPLDTNSQFAVQFSKPASTGRQQITFSTVTGRTYRVEWATALNNWLILQDDINRTGGNVTYTDYRDLSNVGTVFYRVSVR